MSRARNARHKLRKADPVTYAVTALETRVKEIQTGLEAQGLPTSEALAKAVDEIKRREEARHR